MPNGAGVGIIGGMDGEVGTVDGGVMSVPGIGQTSGNEMVPGARGGRIVKPWDSAAAAAAARRRWELASQAARRGMAKAGEQLPNIDRRGPLAVVEYLTEQHTLNAADPSARGAGASLREVMRLAYPAPERAQVAAGETPAGGLTFHLSPELARDLLAELRARGKAE